MKKCLPLLSITAILLLSVAHSNAQAFDNPGTYMDAINNAQTEMNQKYMAYMSAAAHGRRAKKVDKMRQQALESITNSRYKTIDLPIYKGDKSLRQSSIDYIQFCYNVFNEDYKKIVNLEDIAEQSYDQMQAYLLLQEKTNEKIKEASDKMQTAQRDFAARYNVKIVDGKNELTDKMVVAGKLSHYINQVYLLFFKCNWEDEEMVKAMNNKKLTDIEQARSALIKYADEGLLALDTLKTFEGDPTLSNACRQSLQFYKKMASTDVPKLTDFYLKQENFDKIKKAADANSNRTKADVDAYNKAVKEMNASINAFNQTNNNINNGRKQMLENWQNTEKSFDDTHMPYYKG